MIIKHKDWVKRAAWILFILYTLVLIYFLFLSEGYGRTQDNGAYRYNLVLFREIKRFFIYRKQLGFESFVINIFGNVLAFVPFGLVLPIISSRNRKFFNILLLSLELTLTIELMQLLLKVGCFDVDDILLNTLGGIIGYLCFALARYIYDKIQKGNRRK